MGHITYWSEVAKRNPELIAHFEELANHKEKPISIGGVGAGSVIITHVMGIWLPCVGGNTVREGSLKTLCGLVAHRPLVHYQGASSSQINFITDPNTDLLVL